MKVARLLTLAVAALALSSAFASADPVTYSLDKAHTEVGFDIRHFFSKVHGVFKEFSGTIVFDEKNPAAISVDATADTKSIFTNNDQRDNHLRSGDFFAADSFPTLSFKSTKVTAAGDKKYKIAGDLTLRGVTRPVVFDGEFLGAGSVGMGGHAMVKAGFNATTVINRKDYGINWNKVLDNGGMMLADDVTIVLNIEGNQATAGTK